ncbi:MAG: hypothetical protein RMJ81_06470 [Candidatus Kryptonium sp.]|nr:hypothetical protein [Candidatus Kryptonium sp.]MCX7761410.1 hypothetical protein [Candidatus Kryptonium sp.]MDW8109279.1 hypothetical protein [Candidatus Kryptonium sp.]
MRVLFLFLVLTLVASSVALSRDIGATLTLGYRSEKPTVGYGAVAYYRYDIPESFLRVKGFAGQLSVGYLTFPKEDRSAEYSFIPVRYGLSYVVFTQNNVELGVLGDVGLSFVSKPKSETKITGGAGAFVAYKSTPEVKFVGTVKYSAILETIHYLGVEIGILYTLPTGR